MFKELEEPDAVEKIQDEYIEDEVANGNDDFEKNDDDTLDVDPFVTEVKADDDDAKPADEPAEDSVDDDDDDSDEEDDDEVDDDDDEEELVIENTEDDLETLWNTSLEPELDITNLEVDSAHYGLF